ncbi:N-acetylmuramoyl-L-alanine amidase [Anaerospora hongkongensis]|uniref:N-acetylmuramoyl-L-alanine amidase n=1 Tax=Anaerospora hongkongensis TaxID=244830 RepID=A0A4R1PW42_9FIRM|nr:N-acetylmuramoyl-L-alanine amidase [Anaerospora hongkongensis]TCL36546.1 N-acetylmuramoyl-L-alanine amidase [Anaerospora hongkongensis]
MKKSRLILFWATLVLMLPLHATVYGAALTGTYTGVQGRTIVVDPGHGGSDAGALGTHNIAEKDVTLGIALELKKMLAAKGANVVLTRSSDRDVAYSGASDKEELAARVNVANRLDADLFVSIHADAHSTQDAQGTTTYFYEKTDEDRRFAQILQSNLVRQVGLFDRGFEENDYYVLENTHMPAILAEVAFLSNPQEAKLLSKSSFWRKAALGLYNGINNYFLAVR